MPVAYIICLECCFSVFAIITTFDATSCILYSNVLIASISGTPSFFEPSSNWSTVSHMEIVKWWISQNNLFPENDHTTGLFWFLTHFYFEPVSQQYIARYYTKSLLLPDLSLNVFFYIHCMISIWKQMKKSNAELNNQLFVNC